jgi:hypothetical protein
MHTDFTTEYGPSLDQLERIEAKLDVLLELLKRYQPLLDKAEKRLGRSPKFGGSNAR